MGTQYWRLLHNKLRNPYFSKILSYSVRGTKIDLIIDLHWYDEIYEYLSMTNNNVVIRYTRKREEWIQ
jgi:hypothetical protein